MLFGCNYSKELVKLIEEDQVDIDYIKLSLYDYFKEGFEISKALRPVLIHGVDPGVPERIGVKSMGGIDWDRINQDIENYRSPHLGVHLESRLSDWDNETVDLDESTVLARLINGAQIWKEKIVKPILLENVPYSNYYASKGMIEYVSEPHLITRICEETDVGFLLDISHARVTAWYKQEDIFSYLSKLPLERVAEIHLAGPLMTEDTGLRDRHLEVSEIDYQILEWVLQRTNPYVVTLEYGGPGPHFEWRSDINAIARQLQRIKKVCDDLNI